MIQILHGLSRNRAEFHAASQECVAEKFNMPPCPPIFIAIEGIDGSGKSTLSQGIVQFLQLNGRKAILTCEPTEGQYGSRIRKLARSLRPSVAEEYELFL